jgi:hypothetical protein
MCRREGSITLCHAETRRSRRGKGRFRMVGSFPCQPNGVEIPGLEAEHAAPGGANVRRPGAEHRQRIAHRVSGGSQVPTDHQPQRGDRRSLFRGGKAAKPQSREGDKGHFRVVAGRWRSDRTLGFMGEGDLAALWTSGRRVGRPEAAEVYRDRTRFLPVSFRYRCRSRSRYRYRRVRRGFARRDLRPRWACRVGGFEVPREP